jgi:UDP-N-acetylmuramate--alanine ligase
LGKGSYFVAEADESDRSLLKLRPVHAVLTNIDNDHLDEYASLEDLQETFQAYLESVPFQGSVITCNDDPNTRALLRKLHRPVVTYALDYRADYSASRVRLAGLKSTYLISRHGDELGEVKLRVPGRHNVQNSLGAAALALSLGIPFESVCASLGRFVGAERRLEWKGEKEGIWVIDDYGHHPSEIKAALEACRELGRRIVLVFQPHRYSRTAQLATQLAQSFQDADKLFLTDIYAAGEAPLSGVDSKTLSEKVARFRTVNYVPSTRDLLTVLRENTEPGDLLLTMGAGDVWKVGEEFLEESS